mmetsp:Transcript_10609/g.35100  ORF Transcript_10609/g.35100 Transcript_10609/m.35100 type:complete len:80 (-) Transcript_10609:488-727(-)
MLVLHVRGGLAGCEGEEFDFDHFPIALAALVDTAFDKNFAPFLSDKQTASLNAARSFARTRLGQIFIDLRPPTTNPHKS